MLAKWSTGLLIYSTFTTIDNRQSCWHSDSKGPFKGHEGFIGMIYDFDRKIQYHPKIDENTFEGIDMFLLKNYLEVDLFNNLRLHCKSKGQSQRSIELESSMFINL